MTLTTQYIPRLADELLATRLGIFGAVVVEGPKWCGKTTTSARKAVSEFRVADPRDNYRNRMLAQMDVYRVLEGSRPRLIDEWQEVPAIWDAVRYECDQALGRPGQFILTGSATPRISQRPVHSGAGRMGRLRMDTLTCSEAGLSSRQTSLEQLFSGEDPDGISSMELMGLARILCKGGWPVAASMPVEHAMQIASGYLDTIAGEDMEQVSGARRDPAKVRALLASLARNESTLATKRTIRADTETSGRPMAETTLNEYLSALDRMFVIDDVPAWHPSLRSPIRIRDAKKHHLADPSIAVAALGASPESLVEDLKTFGNLFESLVIHDLKVYARSMDATVYHYRDNADLEVDVIIQKRSGEWGAFEVKLGFQQEDAAAANLLRLERKLVARGERAPAVKGVITGIGAIGYRRSDDVCVIPFDSLTL